MQAMPDSRERTGAFAYPWLFAAYPVLFLYLRNIREVPAGEALLALAASLGVAAAAGCLLRILVGHAGRRSLLLFLFLLLFHYYGLLHVAVGKVLLLDPGSLSSHLATIIPAGGAWLLLSALAIRSRASLAPVHRVLRIAVVGLVAWNLAGIAWHHGRTLPGRPRSPAPAARMPADRANDPDIYCFILDEFAAIESARVLFQYDNTAFADRLRQLGFFVARDSRQPVLKTEMALAALLNPGVYSDKDDPFRQIRENAIAAFLKRRGYRVIEFPVSPAMFMEAADRRHYYSLTRVSLFFNDFYRTLFERSALCFLAERWRQRQPDAARYYRERVLQVFETMPAVVQGAGPKFVYVHLYAPHEPFVFAADGGATDAGHFWDHADPRFYLQQYIFISGRMLATAAMIVRDSRRPPVIIIQSDHGYRGSRGRKKWRRRVDPAESSRVFNALLLPGVPLETIPPSLSPADNFSLLLRHIFGTSSLPAKAP